MPSLAGLPVAATPEPSALSRRFARRASGRIASRSPSEWGFMLAPMRLLLKILVLGLVVFFLIQLVPYGRAHDNPVTVQEPKWDSPTTRALAQRGCFDCHSNLTAWPWYTSVAP